jgi:hypothetical protein
MKVLPSRSLKCARSGFAAFSAGLFDFRFQRIQFQLKSRDIFIILPVTSPEFADETVKGFQLISHFDLLQQF